MLILASLDEWWQLLSGAQQFFWVVAGFSSLLFITLFGLSLLGLGGDSDVDIDADADVDLDMDHDSGHDFSLDKDFSAFSIRSIVAFFTFFGWTGVYLLNQGHGVLFSGLIGILTGTAALLVVAYMIYKFAQMEKSGTVNIWSALDQEGEVYLSIPKEQEGSGKIHLVVGGSLHEFDAQTTGALLPSGSPVRVVDVIDDQVLLVEPVKLLNE